MAQPRSGMQTTKNPVAASTENRTTAEPIAAAAAPAPTLPDNPGPRGKEVSVPVEVTPEPVTEPVVEEPVLEVEPIKAPLPVTAPE